jgi:dihydrofolate reductase
MNYGIMAVNKLGGYGFEGRLPWKIYTDDHARDMARFRELTTGSVVVMGSGTWESFNGPLPGRFNVVVSDRNNLNKDTYDEKWTTASIIDYLDSNLHRVKIISGMDDAYFIGGSSLIYTAIDSIDKFYLTIFDTEEETDRSIDLEYIFLNFSVDKRITTKDNTQYLEMVRKT